MRCGGVRRLLSAYADDQTNDKERLAVGLHLSRCHECRQRYEERRRFRLALLSTPRMIPPPEFSAAWRARIRKEGQAARTQARRPWLTGIAAIVPAAACLVLLLTGLAVFLPRDPQAGTESGKEKRGPTRVAARTEAPPASRELAPKARATEPARGETGGTPGSAGPSMAPGSRQPSTMSGSGLTRAAGTPAGDASTRALLSSPPLTVGSSDSAEDRQALAPDGLWRLWLTTIGPRPASLKRALVEAGLLPGVSDLDSLDVPLLLREGLSYSAAHELAQRLEEAGAHVLVELTPR